MGWSHFWLESARHAAVRRQRVYEIEPSLTIKKSIEKKDTQVGFLDSIKFIIYIIFGTPKGFLALIWRYLADRDTPRRKREINELAKSLSARLSEKATIAIGYFERQLYSRDVAKVPKIIERLFFRTTPLIAVHIRDEKDVVSTLRFAKEKKIPVYPRGISSSAFGGAIPTRNGIVLDLSFMSEILEIDPDNLLARIQPAVRWAELASNLAHFGLSTVTTPSSRFSTVAGWVSTGGLGIDSFKYGHIRESVVCARVVLPSGDVFELNSYDERFRYLFGTEGQFGVITELVIRVKPKSDYTSPRLFYFDNPQNALSFVEHVIKEGCKPSHIAFYDRARLAEENLLFRERAGLVQPILEERDAVLVHFDDPDSEQSFMQAIKSRNSYRLSDGPAANYLWSERYFPLKAQRLGPNLLASEIVLDAKSLLKFIQRARRMARRFGINLGIEATFTNGGQCIAIASFRCDSKRFVSYFLYLVLVQLLVHLGTRLGGCPYGIGIWNTPFVRTRYSARAMRDIKRIKREIDPNSILNPMKFFKLRARFFNIPGLLFNPIIYSASLNIARALSPLFGLIAKLLKPMHEHAWAVPAPEDEEGTTLLAQAAVRCTFCGACVSVCPAYLLTHDELVTGRAKLRLSEAILSRKEISSAEAIRAFECLHCSLCEEVCQTRLPLVDCYTALEAQLERRFGRPVETIAQFVELVDKNREWIESTFGLSIADWSPNKRAEKLLKTNQSAAKGEL